MTKTKQILIFRLREQTADKGNQEGEIWLGEGGVVEAWEGERGPVHCASSRGEC